MVVRGEGAQEDCNYIPRVFTIPQINCCSFKLHSKWDEGCEKMSIYPDVSHLQVTLKSCLVSGSGLILLAN